MSVALAEPAVTAWHGRLDEARIAAAGEREVERVADVLNRDRRDRQSRRRRRPRRASTQVARDGVTDE